MSNFFSKSNIHNFVWALIGAFALFLCGLIWNWWSGPQEVKVVNTNQSKKDTTITIIKFEAIELADNEKPDNTQEAKTKTKTKPSYQLNYAIIDSIVKQTLAKQNINGNTMIQSSTISTLELDNSAPVFRPRFNLPTIVSGYTQGKVNSYASININKTEFNQSDFIELTTNFFNPDLLKIITPLFVDIVKRKTENSVYQIWSDQYRPNDHKTKVRISASFPPDKYDLTIGFYLVDELNTKYPTFYSKKFTITIK